MLQTIPQTTFLYALSSLAVITVAASPLSKAYRLRSSSRHSRAIKLPNDNSSPPFVFESFCSKLSVLVEKRCSLEAKMNFVFAHYTLVGELSSGVELEPHSTERSGSRGGNSNARRSLRVCDILSLKCSSFLSETFTCTSLVEAA